MSEPAEAKRVGRVATGGVSCSAGMWPNRAEDPPRWWAQTLGVGVAGVWLILFLITAVFDRVPGPPGHALSIALGTVDPFSAVGADVPAVALAVVSWLLVPAVVGTVAALLTERALRQSRPLAEADAREGMREDWERLKREQ